MDTDGAVSEELILKNMVIIISVFANMY